MDTLLLNARTVRQQPTGIPSQKVVSKMSTRCSLSGPGEQKEVQATNRHPNQKNSEQNAHYLLTTFWDAGQGELAHPGHRLSQRILPCGTYFVTVHNRPLRVCLGSFMGML